MKTLCLGLLAVFFGLAPLHSLRAEANWTTDFAQARAQAKAEHKLLLLDFTGSDWCGWCKVMEKEIFSQPAFEEYAKQNLVLVRLDFPRAKPVSEEVRTQNRTLAQQFGVRGFPTIVMLDGDGKPLAQLGYLPGGPEAFISELKKVPKS
ncbi:MAG: thioredoxin fold domain-containing protein [Chthoniobacterales bacterium]